MTPQYSDLVIGGVLVSPFVAQAAAALVVFLLLRPVLALLGFERAFAHPPVAALSLYVVILAATVVFWP
ncbi:MAG: DUF1656 domain-containing protein [Gluconacetobacter diazotrophicus]|nr:DUF1656 domain-containing protein [Gluconacetobacter diazotrophicus]